MKNKLSILAGIGLLAFTSTAGAQGTATTDPVGYITTTLTGQTAGVRGETFFGPTLYNQANFTGVVSATAAGNVLTLTGAAFTADQFNGAQGAHFLEITNGANAGKWSDITATSATGVTTGDDLSTLITAGTTQVKIRKHHTIASIFGATNTAGLTPGATLNDADQIVLLDATTQLPKTIFYSTDEFAPGWIDAAQANASNEIVAPSQGLLIKRVGATPVSVVQVGHVKTGPTVFAIEPGENLVAVPLATGITLDASTLGTVITSGPSLNQADQVVVNSGDNQFKAVFFSTDEFAPGWIDASQAAAGTTVLKEGSALLIKNNVTPTAFNFTYPAQTIQ